MRNKKKKKKTQSIRTLIVSDILLLLCVCMLGYPIFSDLWNAQHTSQMFGSYQDTVKNMDKQDYETLLQDAIDYNNTLPPQGDSRFAMTDEERSVYQSKLKLPGTDVMAYITCDKIGVKNMPIYPGQETRAYSPESDTMKDHPYRSAERARIVCYPGIPEWQG